MAGRKFVVYDGRAAGGDTDEAQVLLVCSSLTEAKKEAPHHGDDCAVFSYAVQGDQLVDERLEFVVGRG